MKKYFLCFFIFVSISLLCYFYISNNKIFQNIDISFKVAELQNILGEKYRLHAMYFNDRKVLNFEKYDENRIIWLGEAYFNPSKELFQAINNCGIVLVENRKVKEFFDLINKDVFVFPVYLINDEILEDDFAKEYLSKEAAFNRLINIIEFNEDKLTENSEISIDVATNEKDYNSGDYWLAHDLALAFDNNNFKTQINYGDSSYKPRTPINILQRGSLDNVLYERWGEKNVLYLAWSNLKVDGEEQVMPFEDYLQKIIEVQKGFDLLVVSSLDIYSALKNRGIDVEYIPQFTNTKKFYHDYDEKLKSEILFVGNFHFYRKSPLFILERDLPIKIYGKGWPKGIVEKEYIDNRYLRKYYSSAKIVLNDTKQNMKDFGFISNRIFDATACGAFVISDYNPAIEKIYGESIPMWKNEEEFIDLIKFYLENPKERDDKAREAQKITLKYFSKEIISQQFLELFGKIK